MDPTTIAGSGGGGRNGKTTYVRRQGERCQMDNVRTTAPARLQGIEPTQGSATGPAPSDTQRHLKEHGWCRLNLCPLPAGLLGPMHT
eukprot:353127-Chlamydomonas_euryale.AAC.1